MCDLSQEVQRIAAHLNIPLTIDRARSIAVDYDLSAQQQRIAQFRQRLLQTSLSPDDHREMVDYHDEESLLHMNHIGSAKVDRWRDELTPAQVDRIQARVEQWCRDRNYQAAPVVSGAL